MPTAEMTSAETVLASGATVERKRDRMRGIVCAPVGPATAESDAPGTYGYFVKFDNAPEVPVFVAGSSLRVIAD